MSTDGRFATLTPDISRLLQIVYSEHTVNLLHSTLTAIAATADIKMLIADRSLPTAVITDTGNRRTGKQSGQFSGLRPVFKPVTTSQTPEHPAHKGRGFEQDSDIGHSSGLLIVNV